MLVERGPYISFANCGLPYHISGAIAEREQLLVTSEALFEARYRVDVRSRTEALSIDRAAKTVRLRNLETGVETDEPYDRLLLSPGAEAGAAADPRRRTPSASSPCTTFPTSIASWRRSAKTPAAGGGDRRRLHRSRGRGEFP